MKLYVKIFAGLGNQIFQIASAYGMAKNNDRELIIYYSDNMGDYEHNKDLLEYITTIFKNFSIVSEKTLNLNRINTYSEMWDANNAYIHNPNILNSNVDTLLMGYFQCEKYFLEYKEELIKSFTNNEIYESMKIKYKEELENKYFIHYRRGNYTTINSTNIDYDKYFEKAIKYILDIDIDEKAFFYILSDDIEFCKTYKQFELINKSFLENNSMTTLETLYFISLCNKGGICSNSTFSWWGSYLNNNLDKIIIFPDKWMNSNKEIDIFPEKCVKINI